MRDFLADTLCCLAEFALNFGPVLLLAMAVISIPYAFLAPRGCDAAWADYEHRWSFHGGCQIRLDGRWVPSGNVKIDLRRSSTQSAVA